MSWEPSLLDALENLIERRRELDEKARDVRDSSTPSYWCARESDAYDRAKEGFMDKLDEHIDARVAEAVRRQMEDQKNAD